MFKWMLAFDPQKRFFNKYLVQVTVGKCLRSAVSGSTQSGSRETTRKEEERNSVAQR
jgi:hypothetical protein